MKPDDIAIWDDGVQERYVRLLEEKMWGWIVQVYNPMKLDEPDEIFVESRYLHELRRSKKL